VVGDDSAPLIRVSFTVIAKSKPNRKRKERERETQKKKRKEKEEMRKNEVCNSTINGLDGLGFSS
jgi:hypothetical protein